MDVTVCSHPTRGCIPSLNPEREQAARVLKTGFIDDMTVTTQGSARALDTHIDIVCE